jgi:hypothetical protein
MDRHNFESSIVEISQEILSDIHTAMPALVVSFDPSKQTITAQPCLQRKFKELDNPVSLPLIEDIPVLLPGSGDFFLTFDVKKDSYCWLIFSERSLANWIDSGGIVDPASRRKFHLSDCVAFVGINPLPSKLGTVDSDCMTLRNRANDTKITLKTDSIKLENPNGNIELKANGQVAINGSNLTVDP